MDRHGDDSSGEYEPMSSSTVSVTDVIQRRNFPCCLRLVSKDSATNGTIPQRLVAIGPRCERVALVKKFGSNIISRVNESTEGTFQERHTVLAGGEHLLATVMEGVAEVIRQQPKQLPKYVRAEEFWVGDDEDSPGVVVKDDVFRVSTNCKRDPSLKKSYVEWERLRLPVHGPMGLDLDKVESEITPLSLSARCKFSTLLDPMAHTLGEIADLNAGGQIKFPISIVKGKPASLTSTSRNQADQLAGYETSTAMILYSSGSVASKPQLYQADTKSEITFQEMPNDSRDISEAMSFLLGSSRLEDAMDIADLVPTTPASPSNIAPLMDIGDSPPPRLPLRLPADEAESESSGDESYSHPYEHNAARVGSKHNAARMGSKQTKSISLDNDRAQKPKTSRAGREFQAKKSMTLSNPKSQGNRGDSRYGTLPPGFGRPAHPQPAAGLRLPVAQQRTRSVSPGPEGTGRSYVSFEQPMRLQPPSRNHDLDYDSCEETVDADGVEETASLLLRNGLQCYVNMFRKHRVDGRRFGALTNTVLMDDLGVSDASDRIRILQLIRS